ncbi:MAG: hypothetical protein JKY61_10315 [Planctomycetes bacterium]|nr:hypothetical protein [Planctomycetota bacterium]
MKVTQALLLILATTASCVTPAPPMTDCTPSQETGEAVKAGNQDPAAEPTAKPEALEDTALEVQALERELEETRLKLEIAELDTANDLAGARRDLLEADRDVEVARGKWAHFRDAESVLDLAKAQLGVERAISRLESKRQDLQGIIEIYEGEEEARAKDEIIRRNRKGVEFAQKALDQARMEARLVAEFEVPQELESLQWALGAAEAAKVVAQDEFKLAESKARLSLLRARNQLVETGQELQCKQAQLEELKAGGKGSL